MSEAQSNEKFPFGNERIDGKIIAINQRGFGFISTMKVPFTRIYFHWTNLIPTTINFKELKRNDPVDFVLEMKENGTYKAIKIDVLERDNSILERTDLRFDQKDGKSEG